MLSRIISAVVFALMASTLLVPTAAEAGSRWRFLNPGYYFYDPPPRDFYADEYDDDEYYEDDGRPLAYYEPDDDYYEPRYYEGEEPVYIAPKKKQKRTAKAAKPVEKKAVASAKKKATAPSVASVEKKAVTSVEKKAVEKKTASAASGMSCDKAGAIVSGYGFTSVKPTTCTGQVFAFSATRSGKAYVIKLSSASGELTEVKKVQ
jgi:hypothetical protein